MTDLRDILLRIFEELRRRRVPLGLDDYLVALRAVYELTNAEDLAVIQDLCRLFWTKSLEDQLLFDETFAIHMAQYQPLPKKVLPPKPPISETPPPLPPPADKPDVPDKPKPEPPMPIKRQQQSESPILTPRMHPQILGATHPKTLRSKGSAAIYHFTPRPPMDKRDMASIWRKLRRPQREGFSEDLDIQATTDAFAQTGLLFQPVLQYRRRNQAKLVVMIDQGGSMEPFTLFLTALLESIQRSGSLRYIHLFYFHDVPENYLYLAPNLVGARSLESVLSEYCQNTSVLLISDAGAARGHYDSHRIQVTKEVVEKISQNTYLYGWLNPVPKARWANTTAAYIARQLPMFPLDWEGLNDVVNVLRGQALMGVQ